ncbi:MAG: 3-deoxy-7-phosphoheptulonate synthase [Chlamydiales bacterium]|nr:3-deoxy-7-phosphoheptulonate synthase [Chlamydiales bacterium]
MPAVDEIATTLPTPEELYVDIPQTRAQFDFVMQARKTLEAILNGVDSRLVLIIGPCSVHDTKALRAYAREFKELADKVSDRFFLILRTYFEKPRTTIGWKGFLLDPHLDGSYDMAHGVREVRQVLSDITDMGIPVGSEILELSTFPYYSDFLSWGCVGARTSSSPPHRQVAATLPFPIGFKNTVDGSIETAVQGVISANSSHVYLGMGIDGRMTRLYGEGNPSAHIVLRGSEHRPNYGPKDIEKAVEQCKAAEVCHRVVVDCSHDNCFKNYEEQVPAFKSVIKQSKTNPNIAGAMLESNLLGGNQQLSPTLDFGVSITDPCLDWTTTKNLILQSRYSQIG